MATDIRGSAVSGKLEQVLKPILQYVRRIMDMEVAFISEFEAGRRYFRYLDSDESFSPLEVNGSDALDDSYCQRVVDGRLPQLIHNACLVPEALTLPVTLGVPIGAHLSVPVCFSDGRIYGTFCCFSRYPLENLQKRDLEVMHLFGQMIGRYLETDLGEWQQQQLVHNRIATAIAVQGWDIWLQPIVESRDLATCGYECLSRFHQPPGVEQWFLEAEVSGQVEELELACLYSALALLPMIPEAFFITVNLSPKTLLNMPLDRLVANAGRLVLELTEHRLVPDYPPLQRVLQRWRQAGGRFAVDDAGAGFASFRHVLQLQPDMIKLDRSLISGIHLDPGKQALARALIGFAREMNISTVAEGVEEPEERICMQALGVDMIQGYLTGRPQPPEQGLKSG